MIKSNKNILVVSQVFPYPLHDGGKMDIYHRLKALFTLGYQVTLVAFYNPKFGTPHVKPLEKFCQKIFVLPHFRRDPYKILHWKPYSIGIRENDLELKKIEEALIKENHSFFTIIAESHHVLTVASALKESLKIPKLHLRSHNNESKFMLSLAQSSPFLSLNQLFFLFEAFKYKLYEKKLMKLISPNDEIHHISHEELKATSRKYPHLNQRFLPAGIELSATQLPKKSNSHKNILFAGALFSPNNLQGLKWYINRIHRAIIKKFPSCQLIIAGNTKGADRKQLQSLLDNELNIKFYDTPETLAPIYNEAQVFINPMQYGAGVKLKTLDAIMNGLPVVTTTVGNEGTGLIDGQHLFVNDVDTGFEKAICNLLLNGDMREQTVLKAQAFLKENYNQEYALQQIFGTLV